MRATVRRGAQMVRPMVRASRRMRGTRCLTVIGWHRIDDGGGGLSTPRDLFRHHLDALERWGARVLPLQDAVRLSASDALPDRAVALTFDDGYASVLETAWPILKQRHLPATLFVVSEYLDGTRVFPWDGAEGRTERTRLATADEILAAERDGLDIGSHTATHRWLPHLGDEELQAELQDSRKAVEALVEKDVRSIAYPMGGWDHRVQTAAAAAGYTMGITVDRGQNPRNQNPLTLRRSFAPSTVTDFELVLDGAYDWLRVADTWRNRKGPDQ